MDLRRLRYFVVTAEELSFSRAAEKLHVTQPTLSGSIHELEIELGTELFARSGRNVVLNWPGRVLLDEARRILRIADNAVHLTRDSAGASKTTLCVGTIDSCEPGILSKAVARARHLLPELSLAIYALPTACQIRGLSNKFIDVGLLMGPINAHGIATEELWAEPLIAAVASNHPISKRETVDLKEFESMSMIAPDPNVEPGYYAGIEDCYRIAGAELKIAEYVGDWSTMFNLVSAGFGVALIPVSLDATRYSNIATVRLTDADAAVPIMAAWRRDDSSSVLHAFVAAVRSSREPLKERREPPPVSADFVQVARPASVQKPGRRR